MLTELRRTLDRLDYVESIAIHLENYGIDCRIAFMSIAKERELVQIAIRNLT